MHKIAMIGHWTISADISDWNIPASIIYCVFIIIILNRLSKKKSAVELCWYILDIREESIIHTF